MSELKRDIFEELTLSIMQGMFKPRERLMERTLAAQFGVSRTPIREALHKLERMGMVRIVPNQGRRWLTFRMRISNLSTKYASLSSNWPGGWPARGSPQRKFKPSGS